jgi:putative PIN family toxin of toxin-antitoxin system
MIIVSCAALRNELFSVLSRPKFSRFISEPDLQKVMELHDLITSRHELGKILPVTKDPKDDYLFSLSVSSKADYLVTGDKLLLEINRYQNTNVIALAEFKTIVK